MKVVKGNRLVYLLLGSIALVFFVLILLCENDDKGGAANVTALNSTDSVQNVISVPDSLFGFPVDSFDFYQSKIKRNEFLADILLAHDVEYQTIDRLARESKETFDVRYLRHGKKYTVVKSKDSLATPLYFVYEPNSIDFVVYELKDSLGIYKDSRQVEVRTREAAGIIRSSLFEALQEQELSPALAMEMANVYAWTIDFYRIQKNDFFKVVFEERYVDDEFVGVGAIKTALFHHGGADFYAFKFDNTTGEDFFDEEGNSLRKAFLKSPLKFGRLTSGYTMKRFHPVQKRWKAHLGTDYAAPKGTPILAVGDGVVSEARFSRYNGNYVKIRHNSTYTTQYLHMSKIASGMNPGNVVKQGDVIGYVGSTGLATGPHVCFRFWKNGKQVNHRSEPMPPSKPVDPNMLDEFMKQMEIAKKQLDDIETILPEQPIIQEGKATA